MADEKKSNGDIINNFYNTVNKVVNNYGTINEYGPENYGGKENVSTSEDKPVPTFDDMMQIFKVTHKNGYWSSNRSWGVGFQLWQIWGYKGTIQDFVNLVKKSNDAKQFDYDCNQDAVYKMISKGRLSRHLENWRTDGVLEHFCILGEKINDELLKLYPPKEDNASE